MRILTNPGSNLSPETLAHYDIDLSPQQIVVDGAYHDTRDGVDFAQIDAWVASAKKHPYVLGTASSEYAKLFLELGKRDPDILAVMTSRKIIQSHAAALAATRALADQPSAEDLRIRVVDTATTDIGAALLTILAGEARRAGLSIAEVADLIEQASAQSHMVFTVATLDNLIKGGRAGFLRAWVASFLQIKPIIGMQDGELTTVGKATRHDDAIERVAETLASRVGKGGRHWLAIVHGNAPARGRELLDAVRRRVDVEYVYFRPFAPAIYLHTGPGSVGAVLLAVDGLRFVPPCPPRFADASAPA